MIIDIDNLPAHENVLLNMVSLEIREPYNELIAKLSEEYSDNIDWIVSTIASRNPNFSPLFIQCCHLALVKKMVERNHPMKAVVVKSRVLGKVIEKYLSQEKVAVQVKYRKVFSHGVKNLWDYVYQILIALFHFSNQFFYARVGSHKGKFDSTRPIILLEVFILKDSFSSNGYKDRYYPGIQKFLSEEEKEEFYYLPTFIGVRNYFRIFSEIAGCRQKFFLKEHFLRLSDYIFTLLYPFRMLKMRPQNITFLNFDITPLIREEIFYKSTHFSSLMGILNFRFAKRLKEYGIKIKLFVDWFENQIIDRGINYGFRKFSPETPIIGYQGFIVSPQFNVHIHPTAHEISVGVIPHEIAVVGRALIKPTKEFCKDLKVVAAPAFRFNNVWKKRRFSPDPHRFTVLISLPITLKESIEILKLVAGILKQKEFDNFLFHVKPHPVNNPEKIKRLFAADWPRQFEFVSGDFNDCVEKVNLLIGNTSSTCVEALAKGVPVIIIESQSGLTQNPIPENIKEDIWVLCYTAEELTKAMLFYTDRDEGMVKKHELVAQKIKEDYFEPVKNRSVRRFLRLKCI